MSKNINVNPGQYKVGGRERPDEIAKERMKSSRQETARNKRSGKQQKTSTRQR
jgi:hypothetical protein